MRAEDVLPAQVQALMAIAVQRGETTPGKAAAALREKETADG